MLKGKVAVVTASTCGSGLRIACRLAAGGADLAINGSDDPIAMEILRRDLSATYGVRVAYCSADVSKPSGAVTLINDAMHLLGRVDILVNNTGSQHAAAMHEFPVAQWNATLDSDLTSVFLATRAVLPQMLKRDWGRIINVASIYGLVAGANRAAHVACAHGVIGLTKCVALETAASGVTCNAICPNSLTINSPNTRRSVAAREQMNLADLNAAPLGARNPSIQLHNDQLGYLAKFLCSDAAACLNGVALPVDGGRLPR